MHHQRIYEYLVLARGRIMDAVRALPEESLDRRFAMGFGSLRATIAHVVGSEWYYVLRLQGAPVPPYEQWLIRAENPPPLAELCAAWKTQADDTAIAIRSVKEWDAKLVYRVMDDNGRHIEVTTSAEDLFTQLAFHEVHHRAQMLNMLRQLGVTLGDLDFNALMYDRRAV